MLIAVVPGEVVVRAEYIESVMISLNSDTENHPNTAALVTLYTISGKGYERGFSTFETAQLFYNDVIKILQTVSAKDVQTIVG